MSESITIYTKKDIDEMVLQKMNKAIEPFRKTIDSMQIRLLDLENMIEKIRRRK